MSVIWSGPDIVIGDEISAIFSNGEEWSGMESNSANFGLILVHFTTYLKKVSFLPIHIFFWFYEFVMHPRSCVAFRSRILPFLPLLLSVHIPVELVNFAQNFCLFVLRFTKFSLITLLHMVGFFLWFVPNCCWYFLEIAVSRDHTRNTVEST